jgi:TPP-dependent pyruvate/acetoin dehydrogenase alpha subunit
VEIGDVGDEAAALVVYHGPDLVHVYSLPYLHHSSSSPKMRVRARERERERERKKDARTS